MNSRRTILVRAVKTLLLVLASWIVNHTGWPLYPFIRGFLGAKYWRSYVDLIQLAWAHSTIALMRRTKLKLHGELPTSSKRPKIFIANHATEVDWLYLWMLGMVPKNADRTGQVKIILKEDIKRIPVFGWGCSLFQFIFLKRKWELDAENLLKRLKRFALDDAPLWLIIFPEGMTMNTRSLEKSHEFAKKSNPPRPLFRNTLLPRSKGLEAIVKSFIKAGKDPEIFDITMTFDGFSGEIPTWEMGYDRKVDVKTPNTRTAFDGTCAETCHLDIRKFDGSQLIKHHGGVQKWLDERFLRKDELLDRFIEDQQFPEKECGPSVDFDVRPRVAPMLGLGLMAIAKTAAVVALFSYIRSKS